jgi:hypothetical protein
MECNKSILVKISRLIKGLCFVDRGHQSYQCNLKYSSRSVKQFIFHINLIVFKLNRNFSSRFKHLRVPVVEQGLDSSRGGRRLEIELDRGSRRVARNSPLQSFARNHRLLRDPVELQDRAREEARPRKVPDLVLRSDLRQVGVRPPV